MENQILEVAVSNEVSSWLIANVPETGLWAGIVVLAANAITMFLPTKLENKEQKKWKYVANFGLSVLNLASLNILKNKNAK